MFKGATNPVILGQHIEWQARVHTLFVQQHTESSLRILLSLVHSETIHPLLW